MAEPVGFEPTNGGCPITRFPGVLLRPTRTQFPKRPFRNRPPAEEALMPLLYHAEGPRVKFTAPFRRAIVYGGPALEVPGAICDYPAPFRLRE